MHAPFEAAADKAATAAEEATEADQDGAATAECPACFLSILINYASPTVVDAACSSDDAAEEEDRQKTCILAKPGPFQVNRKTFSPQ